MAAPLTDNGTNLSFSSASSGTGIKVVLNTVPGEVYDVSFDYDAVTNVSSAGIYANSSLLQTLTGDGATSLSFTATATTTEFKVLLSGSGLMSAAIDNLLIKHDVQYSLSGGGYRFGFNVPIAIGKESVDEIYGDGNSYTAEFWQYDARTGRRWNVDPVSMKYSWQSPYASFCNNPLYFVDPLGLEAIDGGGGDEKTGQIQATIYFRLDPKELELDIFADAEKTLNDYISAYKMMVASTWNNISYTNSEGNIVTICVDNVIFLPLPADKNAANLKPNEILLR